MRRSDAIINSYDRFCCLKGMIKIDVLWNRLKRFDLLERSRYEQKEVVQPRVLHKPCSIFYIEGSVYLRASQARRIITFFYPWHLHNSLVFASYIFIQITLAFTSRGLAWLKVIKFKTKKKLQCATHAMTQTLATKLYALLNLI